LRTGPNIASVTARFSARLLFKSKRFLDYYQRWNDGMKKDFILTIGGAKNFKKTKGFLDSLINQGESL